MIQARVRQHSINPHGQEALSYLLVYPRFIHQEFLVHRVLSRNSASSRAIPASKAIQRVEEEPAFPIHWGLNQKGMQAQQQLPSHERDQARKVWGEACADAIKHANRLADLKVHKQVVNRVIEPYSHMVTLVTGTEWGNFFNLRAHPDAQPEFIELTRQMLLAYLASTPTRLEWGEWHFPFPGQIPPGTSEADTLRIMTARAARLSYLTFDGDIDPEKDYALHDDLLAAGHMSPFEHSMRAEPDVELVPGLVLTQAHIDRIRASGNVRGYVQYRKTIPGENRAKWDARVLLARLEEEYR